MAELIVVRHAQASFGAANYDKLSPLGHEQSEELGAALAVMGIRPDRVATGEQVRHRETLEGIARGMKAELGPAEILPGLNEFDFRALLDARFPEGGAPEGMHDDRRTHFRTLRDTVHAWQRDEIANPPERWAEFAGRVEAARQALCAGDHRQLLAVSSGGAISQLVAATLGTPPEQQMALQLQMKNCAVTRFVFTPRAFYLHSFNETPHIVAHNAERLLTYS
ncbi:histidine phosphatase family protein [Aquicoccus sp. SCR17]|nr:histidine phosphatase family protein [Carideicomes alvinocaridis]